MQNLARFFPTSLRTRLVLAFLALVSLILFVGFASYSINDEVSTRVQDLRANDVIDLGRVDLSKVGLEIEGEWKSKGGFHASDIEILPRAERPRLRGSIQSLDPDSRSFVLYGMRIHFTEGTESGDVDDGPGEFGALRVGQRVEVTCRVKGGRWEAMKVDTTRVKSNDKIKGCATRWEIDGKAPDTIEIHGLLVVVEPSTVSGPTSALGHMEKATQMILVLQECRSAADELVGVAGRERGEEDGATPWVHPSERLSQAATRLADLVDEALSGGDDPRQVVASDFLSTLRPLSQKLPALWDHVETLQSMAGTEPGRAAMHMDDVFGPFLQDELLPLSYAYLSQSEEYLGDELRRVLDRTDSTTRVALATSVVAVFVAFGLGFLVWRSIHRPLKKLHDAAQRLGQGYLETRIHLDSHDEIGVLASAFNQMASELANTTVSMESLEGVFDSMAAALIVFDPEGHIINVNRATLALVGWEREELIGQTFDVMCRFSAGESPRPGPAAKEPSGLPSIRIEAVEKVFVRKDGSEFPVSFSGAELRPRGGPLQGYVCVALDLTEQKMIQARLKESLGEKELLLREVHHRVKNNMQVISSLLAMQSTGGDPAVAKTLEESQNRIRSIALIHEQLYRSTELSNIDVRSYLEVLTSQLLQSFGKSGAVRTEVEADDITLDIDQSMACGLIVNELVTNALKYAYPDDRAGVIRVSLREHPDGERVLIVADDGPGLPEKSSGPPTLGMSLVKTLARQLRGRVETNGTKGTVVRVFFGRKNSEAVSA